MGFFTAAVSYRAISNSATTGLWSLVLMSRRDSYLIKSINYGVTYDTNDDDITTDVPAIGTHTLAAASSSGSARTINAAFTTTASPVEFESEREPALEQHTVRPAWRARLQRGHVTRSGGGSASNNCSSRSGSTVADVIVDIAHISSSSSKKKFP